MFARSLFLNVALGAAFFDLNTGDSRIMASVLCVAWKENNSLIFVTLLGFGWKEWYAMSCLMLHVLCDVAYPV